MRSPEAPILEYGRRSPLKARLRQALVWVAVAMLTLVALALSAWWMLRPLTAAEATAAFEAGLRLPEGVTVVMIDVRHPDWDWEVCGLYVQFDDTGNRYYLYVSDPRQLEGADHLFIAANRYSYAAAVFGAAHNSRISTGEPVPTWSYFNNLDVGPAGPFADRLPPIRSLADLRDHEQAVIALLESMPQYPQVGTYERDGHTYWYTVGGGPWPDWERVLPRDAQGRIEASPWSE